jgi:hypothetical protein
MFSLRTFRFRSLQRNRETDERRAALIQKTIRSAIADAKAEATGLRARIAKTQTSAVFLVEQIDGGELDSSHRAKLTPLEKDLFTAEERLAQLKVHLEYLRNLELKAASR